jgi:hypothetical protein
MKDALQEIVERNRSSLERLRTIEEAFPSA